MLSLQKNIKLEEDRNAIVYDYVTKNPKQTTYSIQKYMYLNHHIPQTTTKKILYKLYDEGLIKKEEKKERWKIFYVNMWYV